MKIHNILKDIQPLLKAHSREPDLEALKKFYDQHEEILSPLWEDFSAYRGSIYEHISEIDWKEYHDHLLRLDPDKIEKRTVAILREVEKVLGAQLQGDIVIFAAFTMMDGYARFDQGTHRVYLGLDETFPDENAMNILIAHELTHVVRESHPEIWTSHNLNPKMTHDEFTRDQPVVEHLMSEGMSCLVSEILFPHGKPWDYVYQNEKSLQEIFKKSNVINAKIHETLENGHYRELYDIESYSERVPRYSHYWWAWKFAQHLSTKHVSDIRQLAKMPSTRFLTEAKKFKI